MQAPKEWKLSTTTDETFRPEEPNEKRYIPVRDYVRAGEIDVPTGRPPMQSGKSEEPAKSLGYLGAIPTARPPTHPGEMLLEEFLKPLGISQRKLADAIYLPYRQVNEIVNERRPVTLAIALRLTRYLGMSVGFWMNLQMAWDLYYAAQSEAETLSEIEPFPRPDLPELMEPAGLTDEDG